MCAVVIGADKKKLPVRSFRHGLQILHGHDPDNGTALTVILADLVRKIKKCGGGCGCGVRKKDIRLRKMGI